MSIWAVALVVISNPSASYTPRRWIPFWQQACTEDRRNGCLVLSKLEAQYCGQGSGWACNELGILEASGRAAVILPPQEAFERACAMGVQEGCANKKSSPASASADGLRNYRRSQPRPADYPILLQEGQGPLTALPAAQLYDRACQQGWAGGCNLLAGVYFVGTGTARDVPRAVGILERACNLGLSSACADLGVILQEGDGVPSDPEKGRSYLKRACDGGFQRACDRLESQRAGGSGG